MKPYIVYFFIKENRTEYLADVVIEAASAKEACARCKEWYFKKTGKNAFRPTTSIRRRCRGQRKLRKRQRRRPE